MIAVPKLILLSLLAVAAWFWVRWFNKLPVDAPRRRAAAPPPRQSAIEDLVACRVCGAYVAAGASGCGKPGCPLPR